MTINIINHSHHPLPAYETAHAAGMDLRAFVPDQVTIKSLQRLLIPTGLHIELPIGYEAQIRPRSGLAYKHGIGIVNSPGTIDADYRGEIKVILINLSNEPQSIHPADRIAQMVVQKVEQVQWVPVSELNESQRGSGGFGSTGKG
jgi:dUTP pyrophosphatase